MNPDPPKIYGLIGYPVKHSLSRAMHNSAFKHLKDQGKIDYNAEYRLFEVIPTKLKDFILNPKEVFRDTDNNPVRAGDVLGFNITIPHKVRARDILEEKFPFDNSKTQRPEDEYYVKLSGAINTVKRNGGKIEYRNTDAAGFLQSLQELKFEPKDK